MTNNFKKLLEGKPLSDEEYLKDINTVIKWGNDKRNKGWEAEENTINNTDDLEDDYDLLIFKLKSGEDFETSKAWKLMDKKSIPSLVKLIKKMKYRFKGKPSYDSTAHKNNVTIDINSSPGNGWVQVQIERK